MYPSDDLLTAIAVSAIYLLLEIDSWLLCCVSRDVFKKFNTIRFRNSWRALESWRV